MTTNFKIESGIQLLTRLTNFKKQSVENFYPNLIPSGPKHGEVIELYYRDESIPYLLFDLIIRAIMPLTHGGADAGVLLFNCGEDFHFELLVQYFKRKLSSNENFQKLPSEDQHRILEESLKNFSVLQIFDSNQLHITILQLESILIDYPNVTLIIFESLHAFYWSEQNLKIEKMDIFLKNLIKAIQKVVRQFSVSILYTRPEYFSSSREILENLEPCCNTPTQERLNYRIQIYKKDEEIYQVNIRTFNYITHKQFKMEFNLLEWL